MQLRHVVPFLLLFAWQSAPAPVPRDRLRPIRLVLGGGVASADYRYWGWEGATCDCPTCGHQAIEQARDEVSSLGIEADAWLSPTARVSAALGSSGATDEAEHPATFAAALVAWDGPVIGVGAGWATAAARAAPAGPAAYLRIGPLDGPQLRADLRAPTPTPSIGGWARVGVAYGSGRRGEPSVFVGVGAVQVAQDTLYDSLPTSPLQVTRPAFVVDASIGFGGSIDMVGRLHVAAKARGFALGAAIRLGH